MRQSFSRDAVLVQCSAAKAWTPTARDGQFKQELRPLDSILCIGQCLEPPRALEDLARFHRKAGQCGAQSLQRQLPHHKKLNHLSILKRYAPGVIYDSSIDWELRSTIEKMMDCRSGAFGSNRYLCNACTSSRVLYNTCSDRHCVNCGESLGKGDKHWIGIDADAPQMEAKSLAHEFSGNFIDGLKELYYQNRLEVPLEAAWNYVEDQETFDYWVDELLHIDWQAHSESTPETSKSQYGCIHYNGRYVRGGAINNNRNVDDDGIYVTSNTRTIATTTKSSKNGSEEKSSLPDTCSALFQRGCIAFAMVAC